MSTFDIPVSIASIAAAGVMVAWMRHMRVYEPWTCAAEAGPLALRLQQRQATLIARKPNAKASAAGA